MAGATDGPYSYTGVNWGKSLVLGAFGSQSVFILDKFSVPRHYRGTFGMRNLLPRDVDSQRRCAQMLMLASGKRPNKDHLAPLDCTAHIRAPGNLGVGM